MEPKIGPTGVFPLGTQIDSTDRGGIYTGFKAVPSMGVCVVEFGTIVSWVALGEGEAAAIVGTMRASIEKHWPGLTFTEVGFPLTLQISRRQRLVKVLLPFPGSTLVANPEVFLVLALRIERAMAQLGTPLQKNTEIQ